MVRKILALSIFLLSFSFSYSHADTIIYEQPNESQTLDSDTDDSPFSDVLLRNVDLLVEGIPNLSGYVAEETYLNFWYKGGWDGGGELKFRLGTNAPGSTICLESEDIRPYIVDDGDFHWYSVTLVAVGDCSVGVRFFSLNNVASAFYPDEIPSLFADDDLFPSFYISDYELAPIYPDTRTRVVTTVPSDNAVIATSTTFGFGGTVYVSEEDYDDNVFLTVAFSKGYKNPGQLATDINAFQLNNPFADGQGDNKSTWQVTSSGLTSYASSTDASDWDVGKYTVYAELYKTTLFGTVRIPLDKKADYFIIGTSTAFDNYIDSIYDVTNQGLYAYGDCSIDFTSLFDLSLYSDTFLCLTSVAMRLVIPDGTQLAELVQNSRNEILLKAPFGYATRIYDIFQASTTPASLPSTATVIPANLPGAGTAINFDVFTQIPIAIQTIEAQTVPTMQGNPMTNFLYWWEILWKIVFCMWVIKQFYGAFSGGDFDALAPGPAGRFERDVNKRRRSFAVNREAMRRGADNSDMKSKY